jgi:DNA-directed RNA polymerase III subunit RPC11
MLSYCPTCANLLLVELDQGTMRYFCQTCPYIYNIDRKISMIATLKRKEVDDVLGGENAWKNVQKTDVACPSCAYPQAYFKEIQTRSADEPATLFFKCAKCDFQWKEG